MIREAKKHQIFEIFNIEDSIKYVIPKYQREYMWGQNYWEQLCTDLIDNDLGYFLGPIICISREKDALKLPRPYEIIDGQQRLTTISLIYAAIYKRYSIEKREDIDFLVEMNNLKHKIIQKRKEISGQLKIQLSTQNENLSVYKWILYELDVYEKNSLKKPKNLGNRRLYKAYKYFENKFLEINEFDKIESFLDKLNQAWVVIIYVENHSDAFMLFESLNNRGMPLSPMDLIKNKLLANLEERSKGTIDSAFEKWKYMIENLEDHSTQERFLRQFYNALKYKEKIKVNIKGITRATRSNLIRIYEELIKKDSDYIFKELIEKSEIYNMFINLENEETPAEFLINFRDLLNIGATPSRTLLLYLFSEHSSNIELISKVLNFLVKYFVRRHLTDYPGTRRLDQIFIEATQLCEEYKDDLTPEILFDFFTQSDKFSSSSKFLEKLYGNIYEINVQVTRFILSKIEEKSFTDETKKDLWEKSGKKLLWTIEHILPQGENLKKSWVDTIAGGNKDRARVLQIQYTHKLGNLTLTGYNPNLSNSDFITKRNKKDRRGSPIGFKNKLTLNKELEDKESWTIDDIQNRTAELGCIALELFDIELGKKKELI